MADTAKTAEEAIERLKRHDPTLKWIDLYDKQYTDAKIAELADCLLAHPDVVTCVGLNWNRLTDKTGVKLARYVATSSTIEYLSLSRNRLGSATYLALAKALRVNTSLKYLHLSGNQVEDESRIEAALVEALQLNPSRPAGSMWWLYSTSHDFFRLQSLATQLGPPSMLSQLNACET